MKIFFTLFVAAGLLGALAAPAAEPTLAEKICASYTQVESVSCRVRKTSEVDGKTATLLSQVYYQRPDRMHVENIAPFRRRIISDGRQFYDYVEGQAKGFSCPLAKLEGERSIMQKSVPGSAMEHLLRLRGVTEIPLAGVPGYPVRRGYARERVFVVLACDAEGRLARIEFFKTPEMKDLTALVEYGDFKKVTDTCWLTGLQQGTAYFGAKTVRETRRFDNLVVNKPITAGLFDAAAFFPKVDFTDDFSKLMDDIPKQEKK
ncbi:MAG: hypothetical protein WC381_00590 [Kiritimatiellia bacterium]|jgi:hypothetical protein